MIRRLIVSNFRSVGTDVVIDLGRLTVLVGPNGSGKSSVVDVLQFLSDSMRLGLDAALARREGLSAVQRWSAGRPYDVSIRVDYEDDQYAGTYAIVIGSSGAAEAFRVKREFAMALPRGAEEGAQTSFTVQNGRASGVGLEVRVEVEPDRLLLPVASLGEGLRRLYEALRDSLVYALFPDTLRRPTKKDPTRPMRRDGENWTTTLEGVLKGPRADDLRDALHRLTGDVADVRVRQNGGFLSADFKHLTGQPGDAEARRQKWLSAGQESDGTLRFAGILTALLQDSLPAIIGLEEPELTIHPGALRLLYDHLEEASHHTQVVVTTHSPDLLDWVNPSDVRVVERVRGLTTVGPMAASQQEKIRKRLLSFADVMRSEGLATERRTGADIAAVED